MTQLESEAFLEMLAMLANTAGIERVEAAVKRALAECDFFPARSQLEVLIPARPGESPLRCGLCSKSEGWIPVTVSRRVSGVTKEYPALKKCEHLAQRTFRADQIEHEPQATRKEFLHVIEGLPAELQNSLRGIFAAKGMP